MSDSITRKTLFRWAGWFALANSVVFGLVSLRYLGSTGLPETALAWIYLVAAFRIWTIGSSPGYPATR